MLPMINQIQKWKYFTQKSQITSHQEKKNPPVKGDSSPHFLGIYGRLSKFLYRLFLAQNLFHIVFVRSFLINKKLIFMG